MRVILNTKLTGTDAKESRNPAKVGAIDLNRLSSTYAANLPLTDRLALARECDKKGFKAQAAIIRSGIADHLLQLTNCRASLRDATQNK